MRLAAWISLYLVLSALAADRAIARTLPFWQQTDKSDAEIKAEKALRKQLMKQYKGDPVLVSNHLMAAGWVLVVRGGPDTAIKRFNEAELFTPGDPNIPHGIMIAAGIRGDDLFVLRDAFDLAMARSQGPARSSLQRDFGQVLLSQGHNREALCAFRQSLHGGHANEAVLISIARLFYAQDRKAVARLYFNWAERVTQ